MKLANRILIIGISGTGKSTLSRKLAKAIDCPLYHMDSIHWQENWIKTPPKDIESKLNEVAQTKRWIVEGWLENYSKSIIENADLVLYLDYPGWVAFLGGLSRWIKYYRRKRPELPNGCTEFLDTKYLRAMLLQKERPHIEAILEAYHPKDLVRSYTRQQTNDLLKKLIKRNRTTIASDWASSMSLCLELDYTRGETSGPRRSHT